MCVSYHAVFLKLTNVTLQNEHTSWLFSRFSWFLIYRFVYYGLFQEISVCRYFWRTSQPFWVNELYWFYWACALILYGAHSMPLVYVCSFIALCSVLSHSVVLSSCRCRTDVTLKLQSDSQCARSSSDESTLGESCSLSLSPGSNCYWTVLTNFVCNNQATRNHYLRDANRVELVFQDCS